MTASGGSWSDGSQAWDGSSGVDEVRAPCSRCLVLVGEIEAVRDARHILRFVEVRVSSVGGMVDQGDRSLKACVVVRLE